MSQINGSAKYKIKLPKYVETSNYILGIAEKPTAAKRIASTLDPKNKQFIISVRKTQNDKTIKLPDTTGYLLSFHEHKIVIIPAFGHLFTLIQDGYGWQYPVYDFKWVPTYESVKNANLITKFHQRVESTVESLRLLANNTETHVIMTDYDEEGEVIGGVILSELVGEASLQSAKRMKYSSFAKKELEVALSTSLDASNGDAGMNFGMYNRGLMRHYLDWLWGINLSRALMISLKNSSGKYSTLSTGRVQGPTLAFVAERQLEISTHVPIPRFSFSVKIKNQREIELKYSDQFISSFDDAESAVKNVTGKSAKVKNIEKKTIQRKPPFPFNLSSLQSETYRLHKIPPSRTLKAAESLYLGASISYPRTGSEKYPSDLNHKGILNNLGRDRSLTKAANSVLSGKKLKPLQGKKNDPAHPCIYPTGILPGKSNADEKRIFSLIAHRYFASFGSAAIIENIRVDLNIGRLEFHTFGKQTINRGWMSLAGIQGKSTDIDIPTFDKLKNYPVTQAEYTERFTPSAPYYNQSSLLKKMEKEEIGTKATRSEIIKSLFDRKFLSDDQIIITLLGRTINDVLYRFSRQVVSVELSRKVEQMGDLIEKTINEKTVDGFTLSDAIVQGITLLHSMLGGLQDNEAKVGELIDRNLSAQRKRERIVATCYKCHTGDLKIITSTKSGKRFVGCTNYFNDGLCNVTHPLPQQGRLEPMKKMCPADGFPQIKVFSGKRPWTLCLNPECTIRDEIMKKKRKPRRKKEVAT